MPPAHPSKPAPHRTAARAVLAASALAAALCLPAFLQPAAAHETGTTATATTATATTDTANTPRPPLSLVVTAAALVALMGALAVRLARGGGRHQHRASHVAAVALLFTGVAHIALTPEHWAEGWHLGLFFALSGALLVAQSISLWKKPSAAVYRSVLATTLVLLVLYVVARQATLPLIDHRDPYLFEDLPVKVAELLAAAVAIGALLVPQRRPAHQLLK